MQIETIKEAKMEKEVKSDKTKLVAGIDLNKLVKKAQDCYEKKEAGLASQLTTGKTIIRPSKDSDYIVWDKGNYWQALTGLKGLPFGRLSQISGKPDSGKSTSAGVFMAAAQRQGYLVILWDAEKKFNSNRYDNKMGGSSDNLLVIDTNNILDGAKAVAHFVNSAKEMNPDAKILIVWDSVGASINSSEDTEEENYSLQPGVSAKQNAYTVRKFNKLINKYMNKENGEETIAVLLINQTYVSIGMGAPTQIDKGGTEIYYLSSVIVQMSRKQDLIHTKDGQKFKYGIVSRAKVKKNHLFEGDENLSELDIVVSADGIRLASDVKKFDDIKGWDDTADDKDEE